MRIRSQSLSEARISPEGRKNPLPLGRGGVKVARLQEPRKRFLEISRKASLIAILCRQDGASAAGRDAGIADRDSAWGRQIAIL